MKNDLEMKITPCKQKKKPRGQQERKKEMIKNMTDFCTIQLKLPFHTTAFFLQCAAGSF